VDAGAFARSHASFTAPAGVQSADLQKAVDAAVDASIKRDELLLDKLLLVVGLYSTILSLLALSTVVASRQDAKEQLAGLNAKADALTSELEKKLAKIKDDAESAVNEQLSSVQRQTESLDSEVKLKLDEIVDKAHTDVDGLLARLVNEFPSISRLQERVQSLILDLEDRFPEDENLNRPRKDSWQSEEIQQSSLIDESQILAVSVVALDAASLLKLYLALARFYFDRFRTGLFAPSDAARAYIYASRAIKCSPRSADAYRMRGATTLSRYDAPSKKTMKSEEVQDLLQQARTDFNQCIELDQFNAGAFYNLALISLFEYKDKQDKPDESALHLDKAIQISESLLAVKESVSRKAKEKYFPDVYINLACFFVYKSKTAADPAVQKEFYDRIVKTCTDGRDYLWTDVESSKAKNNFKESLGRELGTNGDFAGLPLTTRAALEALLLAPKDKPVS